MGRCSGLCRQKILRARREKAKSSRDTVSSKESGYCANGNQTAAFESILGRYPTEIFKYIERGEGEAVKTQTKCTNTISGREELDCASYPLGRCPHRR